MPTPTFDAIAQYEVTRNTAASSSITFLNIPQTYTDLQLRVTGRSSRSDSTADFPALRFNNDSTGTYSRVRMFSNGGGGTNGETAINQTGSGIDLVPTRLSPAGLFSSFIIDVMDYATTGKARPFLARVTYEGLNEGYVLTYIGQYNSTSTAISRVDLVFNNNWVEGTIATLYGIKAGS